MIPPSIPPRRIRRRIARTAQFREAFALQEQEREAFRAGCETTLVPLDAPVRAGWRRYWAVRPDLAASVEGEFLARVLRLVQREETSNRRDFAVRSRRRGNKLTAQEHRLKSVDLSTYLAMTARMRREFVATIRRHKATAYSPARVDVRFTVARPWAFVSRTAPNYRTHERVYLRNTDSDEAWLRNKLYGPEYRMRHLARHYAWSSYNRYDGPAFEVEPLVEDAIAA